MLASLSTGNCLSICYIKQYVEVLTTCTIARRLARPFENKFVTVSMGLLTLLNG